MSKEFEPYEMGSVNNEFSVWEYQNTTGDGQSEMSAPDELINESELLKQDAIEKGYAEGMQQAQAEINEKKMELANWLGFLQKPMQLLDETLTQDIIQTIIWLSQYCIGVELSVNPDKLRDLFREIKEELPSLRGSKVLTMHPSDVDWIKAELDEKEIPGLHEVLVADSSLNRGDFYLKGDHNELDGRIQSRFTTLFAKYINQDTLITPVQSQD